MRTLRTLAAALATMPMAVPASAGDIERLDPAAFTEVPPTVRAGLQRLGCTIPQSFTAKRPENVIRGSFTERGAAQWAALCSVNGTSDIVIFRAGAAEPVARLAQEPDDIYVQVVAPGRSGYSRLLATGHATSGGLNPIHDAFVEKASIVWYRVGTGWRSKISAD